MFSRREIFHQVQCKPGVKSVFLSNPYHRSVTSLSQLTQFLDDLDDSLAAPFIEYCTQLLLKSEDYIPDQVHALSCIAGFYLDFGYQDSIEFIDSIGYFANHKIISDSQIRNLFVEKLKQPPFFGELAARAIYDKLKLIYINVPGQNCDYTLAGACLGALKGWTVGTAAAVGTGAVLGVAGSAARYNCKQKILFLRSSNKAC